MNKQEDKTLFTFSETKYIKYSDYFFTFYFKCSSKKTIGDVNGIIRIDCI